MKKILLAVSLTMVIVIAYIVYDTLSFNPLNQKDFQMLFKGYKGDVYMACSKDFLGMSSNGEIFEVYRYNVADCIIDKNFPNFINWENKEITNETKICKWKHCPLTKQTRELYSFTFKASNFDEIVCFDSFNSALLNQNNFYSFIYFNDLEQYFLLYCTDNHTLYYVRRKGF